MYAFMPCRSIFIASARCDTLRYAAVALERMLGRTLCRLLSIVSIFGLRHLSFDPSVFSPLFALFLSSISVVHIRALNPLLADLSKLSAHGTACHLMACGFLTRLRLSSLVFVNLSVCWRNSLIVDVLSRSTSGETRNIKQMTRARYEEPERDGGDCRNRVIA